MPSSSCETLGVEPGCVLTDRLERERDEAREECRQCRADIRRLVEVRDEALAEVERLKGVKP